MILVTGGTGFLGRHVVLKLAAQGDAPVRCLIRPGSDTSALDAQLTGLNRSGAVQYFPASFNDPDALRGALDGVETVYHIAASMSGGFAAQTANTVVGTDNLLRAAKGVGLTTFVLVGSFSVMGIASLPRQAIVDETVALENSPEQRDAYTYAKLRQEQLAWDYHRKYGIPVVVVRPGVIYGPGARIITTRIALEYFGIHFLLGGSNPIPLTYVDNCADAIIAAGRTPEAIGQALNICDDDLPTARQVLSWYRARVKRIPYFPVPFPLLKLLSRVNVWYSEKYKGNLPVVVSPYIADTIWKRQRFSNQKAKSVLSWTPRVSIEDGLAQTFRAQKLTPL